MVKKKIISFIIILILTSCIPQENANLDNSLENYLTSIKSQKKEYPGYIVSVWPVPNSSIDIGIYQASLEENLVYTGVGIEIDVFSLMSDVYDEFIRKNGQFTQDTWTQEYNLTLSINDERISAERKYVFGVEGSEIRTKNGEIVYNGPTFVLASWKIELLPGNYVAKIQVEWSKNLVYEFEWAFRIND